MTEFIISSEQLERIIEYIEHDTGREINRLVIDGVRAREIVRCRDCKHYMSGSRCNLQDDCNEFHWLDVEPNGFCAWGERRDA